MSKTFVCRFLNLTEPMERGYRSRLAVINHFRCKTARYESNRLRFGFCSVQGKLLNNLP